MYHLSLADSENLEVTLEKEVEKREDKLRWRLETGRFRNLWNTYLFNSTSASDQKEGIHSVYVISYGLQVVPQPGLLVINVTLESRLKGIVGQALIEGRTQGPHGLVNIHKVLVDSYSILRQHAKQYGEKLVEYFEYLVRIINERLVPT